MQEGIIMCGRYQAWLDDDELLGIIEREKKGSAAKYFRRGEIFPGDEMPIIYGSYAAVRAHCAVWGFKSQFTDGKLKNANKLIINARAETAADKPMFSNAFKTGRALVLASGYYEWLNGQKYRYYNDGSAILMAALERTANDEREYVILTTIASGTPSVVHDRMPVFVERDEMKDWLYDEEYARSVLTRCKACSFAYEAC